MQPTNSLAETLAAIATAGTVTATAQHSLAAIVARCQPVAAAVLVWDHDLGRYIVGDTWLEDSAAPNTPAPGEARRRFLAWANAAQAQDCQTARQLEVGVFYQPLNITQAHVGALVCQASHYQPDAQQQDWSLLLQVVAHALHTATRLAQANQVQVQLQEDRTRLEHLLEAVDQQQRTIDRLLAAEREFSARLEAKVKERTAELEAAQRRLIQSEKLAVIGKLASSLAHEINNPLQAIQSGLGLVIDELNVPPHSDAGRDLATIQAELERIQSIFRQLLDLNRPMTPQQRDLPLDANTLCQDVYLLMRKRLEQINVRLTLDLANDLPLTCGDANQMKQVVLNLTLNAAEAMPDDTGGHITLRTYAEDGQVCISVIDDGRGIGQTHLKQLFDPLFTTKTRGLGLGLSISQEIVQQHRGEIVVNSVPQQGTTFTVRLPKRRPCDGEDTDR